MPAKNPRLTLTLEPSLKAQLERLSELTGNSQGALVSDLLKESSPVFDRLIKVLEAAHEARENLSAGFVEGLEATQNQLETQLGLAMDLFDVGAKPILEEAEKVKRRAARSGRRVAAPAEGAREACLTPPSNRGVRSQGKKAKTSVKSRG